MPHFLEIKPVIQLLMVRIPNLLNLMRLPIARYGKVRRVTVSENMSQLRDCKNSVVPITGQLLKQFWCQQQSEGIESHFVERRLLRSWR